MPDLIIAAFVTDGHPEEIVDIVATLTADLKVVGTTVVVAHHVLPDRGIEGALRYLDLAEVVDV